MKYSLKPKIEFFATFVLIKFLVWTLFFAYEKVKNLPSKVGYFSKIEELLTALNVQKAHISDYIIKICH